MLPGGQILCPADMQDDSYVFSIKGPLLGHCGCDFQAMVQYECTQLPIKNILEHRPVFKIEFSSD